MTVAPNTVSNRRRNGLIVAGVLCLAVIVGVSEYVQGVMLGEVHEEAAKFAIDDVIIRPRQEEPAQMVQVASSSSSSSVAPVVVAPPPAAPPPAFGGGRPPVVTRRPAPRPAPKPAPVISEPVEENVPLEVYEPQDRFNYRQPDYLPNPNWREGETNPEPSSGEDADADPFSPVELGVPVVPESMLESDEGDADAGQ